MPPRSRLLQHRCPSMAAEAVLQQRPQQRWRRMLLSTTLVVVVLVETLTEASVRTSAHTSAQGARSRLRLEVPNKSSNILNTFGLSNSLLLQSQGKRLVRADLRRLATRQTLVFRFEAARGRRFVRLSRVEDVSYAGATTTSTSRMLDSTELAAAAAALNSPQLQ